MFFLHEKRIIIPKTRVRSATLDPNKVPNHNHGTHSITALIDTKVSGKIDITATMISPTINFEILKFSANLTAYFVESIAHLTIINIDTDNINILVIIDGRATK